MSSSISRGEMVSFLQYAEKELDRRMAELDNNPLIDYFNPMLGTKDALFESNPNDLIPLKTRNKNKWDHESGTPIYSTKDLDGGGPIWLSISLTVLSS